MNCNECRRHWELYYDSEGDSELYLEINEHLSECPSCAKWFFQQQQFEVLMTSKLSAPEPNLELWDRVLSESGIARPAAVRSWMFFGSALAMAASLLVAVMLWRTPARGEPDHLSALTAVVHREFAEAGKPIEFASASDQEVEEYLKRRVPFAVRCPPREDAGFEVKGGGVCAIAGDSAAYVVGRVKGQEVSVFILPRERLSEFSHERSALATETIHHCREGRYDMVLTQVDQNIVVVIGRADPAELERVARAYGTYPEQPGAMTTPARGIPATSA